MKTGVFIGRFQPLHDGHCACINKILEHNDHCIVILRDTEASEKNPFPVEKREKMVREKFPDESKVSILTVSDPGADLTVYIGRDVGYNLIQLDPQLEDISATDIRKKLYSGKENVQEHPL